MSQNPSPMATMAARLLPRAKRQAARTIFSWHQNAGRRLAEAMAHDGGSCAQVVMTLQQEAMRIGGVDEPADATLRTLWEIGRAHHFARSGWSGVVDGWNAFAVRQRYRDWTQLQATLHSLAVGPARMVLAVLGTEENALKSLADAVGYGVGFCVLMQRLENGLSRGRIYLPDADLERFRVSATDLAERRATPQFQDLMWFEAKRAREYFDAAASQLGSVPDDGSRAFVGVLIDWQREVLDRIEKSGFQVFKQSFELSRWEAVKFVLARRRDYGAS